MRIRNYTIGTLETEFQRKNNYKNNSINLEAEITFERLLSYNTIIDELLELNYNNLVSEITYRISDNENPNEVFKSVITRSNDTKSYIGYHLNAIQHYIDMDFMKIFK